MARNLLTNAFKFTSPGGTVRIVLKKVDLAIATPLELATASRADGRGRGLGLGLRLPRAFSVVPYVGAVGPVTQPYLRVEVVDSGAGISKENQQKLFGQYVQFDANKLQKGGGSGLGLWISRG